MLRSQTVRLLNTGGYSWSLSRLVLPSLPVSPSTSESYFSPSPFESPYSGATEELSETSARKFFSWKAVDSCGFSRHLPPLPYCHSCSTNSLPSSLTSSQQQKRQASVTAASAKPTGSRRGKKAAASAVPNEDVGAMTIEERQRLKREKLNEAIAQINKKYGEGTCASLDGGCGIGGVKTFSTGILPLDVALGGGWPQGKIVEIYGHESTGKTTIALYAIAQVQKSGEFAALIDCEHALNKEYAEKLGVITDGQDKMLVIQPGTGEQAVDIAENLIRSGHVRLVVFDSVSAMVPAGEIEGTVGEGSLGQLARLMSNSLRRLAPIASKSNTTLIFLNQIRNKIGAYGNPETTSGGLALKFHASVRCEVRAVDKKREADREVGYRCRVRLAKSKLGNAGRIAEFEMRIGEGVQEVQALLEIAEKMDLVEKKGAWYYVAGQSLQGIDKAVAYLKSSPEVLQDLEEQVKRKIEEGNGPPVEEEWRSEDEDDSSQLEEAVEPQQEYA